MLDISDNILLVVGLDTLGLDGYLNSIQYFVDSDINLDKISHIIPTGYHPVKLAPKNALKQLKKQVAEYTPKAVVTTPVADRSVIRNCQELGLSLFDSEKLDSKFHEKNRITVKNELQSIFDDIKL